MKRYDIINIYFSFIWRGIMKKFLCALLGIMIGVSSTTVIAKAATVGTSIRICYSDCGQHMGNAALRCEFNYSDGNWVEADEVSVFFDADSDYNYYAYFDDIRKSQGVSVSDAFARCDYYVSDDVCYEFGVMDVSCDIYGQIEDNGYYYKRGCNH